MKQPLYFIVFASLLILGSCTKVEISQWRGPNRDGIYPEKNLLTEWPEGGPQLLWKYDSLGCGYSSAAVTSKNVYTVGTIDSISYVFNFDKNGELIWKKPLGREWMVNWPGIRSTPTIYGTFGYVINGLGVLYCFNAIDGNILWSKDLLKEYNSKNIIYGLCDNLLVDEEKVYCTPAGPETDVVALDRKTGDLIWKSKSNHDTLAYGSPIFVETGDKKILINATKNSLFALNSKNGDLEWRFDLNSVSQHPNTPIYRNGQLFFVDGWKSGSILLQLQNDGSLVNKLWHNTELEVYQGDVVVLDDRIYGVYGGKRLLGCIDWNTGIENYADSIISQTSALISDGSMIYSYEDKGAFYLLKPTDKDFEKCGSFNVEGGTRNHYSYPVIKDGKLYVRHDNSLFVYNIAK